MKISKAITFCIRGRQVDLKSESEETKQTRMKMKIVF